MFKWYVPVVAALLFITGCTTGLVDFSAPYQASVQIKNGGADHCSGTMISQTDTTINVLTAGHCAASDLTIITETCGTMKVTGGGTVDNPTSDLAVLVATKNAACEVKTASLASEIVVGEPVVVVGYPAPLGKTIAFGYVGGLNDTGQNGILFNTFELAGGPGNSGSSIFNSDGDIVGVLTGPASPGFGLVRGDRLEDIVEALKAVQ